MPEENATLIRAAFRRSARGSSLILAALYLPAVAILAAVAVAVVFFDVAITSVTRDLADEAGVSPLTGALSTIGVLVWCTTAAVTLFSGTVMSKRGEKRQASFLFCFGLLTLILLLDDLFMFHEDLAPRYLGIPDTITYAVLAGLTAASLIAFRDVIWRSEYLLLILALMYFSFSVVTDASDGLSVGSDWMYLVEDGAKFLGIVSWAGYFVRHAYRQISEEEISAPVRAEDGLEAGGLSE
jgi:hypothetical protein